MNVNFPGGPRGGAKENGFPGKQANSPPRTLSFIRVSVRSWENLVNPGNAPDSLARQREPAGPGKVKTAAGVPTKCPGLF